MKLLIILIAIFSICFDLSKAADSPCGDWEPYKDEKCYKIFDAISTQNFTDAEAICSKHDNSRLISIHFKEEEDFLVDYLFKRKKIVDNVWIGAKFGVNKYAWEDGSSLTYTNWASGSPKNRADYCVQMHADEEARGKWTDEPCKKKNLVVCQKKQTLSLARMQEILFEMKLNPVPIGFIYVQLSKEKAPAEIWPWLTWTDISSTYDSVFFRVVGSSSATFGQVQEEFAPNIDQVANVDCLVTGCTPFAIATTVNIPTSGWSGYVVTADQYTINDGARNKDALKFHTNGGEVRPKNMAMKVWKRTA